MRRNYYLSAHKRFELAVLRSSSSVFRAVYLVHSKNFRKHRPITKTKNQNITRRKMNFFFNFHLLMSLFLVYGQEKRYFSFYTEQELGLLDVCSEELGTSISK